LATQVSFEALRRVQLAEKTSPSLSPLEEDFYESYRGLVAQMQQRLTADFSLEGANSYESTRKILADIIRRREQKILLRAMHDFESGTIGGEGLASEEKGLYKSLITLISAYRPSMAGQPAPSVSQQQSANGAQVGAILVRMLVDVPRFVGTSGPVGPLQAGSTVQLSSEDAQLLLSQGAAQKATNEKVNSEP
jgi:hypothetical protein